VAESARIRVGGLRVYFGFSEAGNLRSIFADGRAAVSIPANIAEGFRRRGRPDKARFMNIAEASLEETRYYLILAQDLGYGDTTQLTRDLDQMSRMLTAYARAILASDS
jgi:hypothetical protein